MADKFSDKFFTTNVIEIVTSIDNLGRKDDNPYEGERDNPSLRHFKGVKSYDVLKMHREDCAILIYCTDWKQLILWADYSCHDYAAAMCESEHIDYSTIDVGDGNFVLFAPYSARLEKKLAEYDYFVEYDNKDKEEEEADEADSETDEDEADEAEADKADSETDEDEAEEAESDKADFETDEAEAETDEDEAEEEEEEFEAVTVTDEEGNEILSLECESGVTEQCLEQAVVNTASSIFSGLEVADRYQDYPKVRIDDELSKAVADAEAAAEAAKNLAESSEPTESEIELKGAGEGFKLPPVAAKSEEPANDRVTFESELNQIGKLFPEAENADESESELDFGEGFFGSDLGDSDIDIGDLSEFE